MEKIELKNIVLTGSTGFVGSYFLEHQGNLNIVEADLIANKPEDISLKGIDVVVHLAALVHQMKGAPVEQYFKINRDLAYEMARHAKSKGIKQFIFLSTVKVYGEYTSEGILWDEDFICKPIDAYGKSKMEAEKLLMGLQDDEFNVVIIRCPLVYGEGVKGNMLRLIKMIDRLPVLPFKNIQNKRSMVYVGNLVAMVKKAIDLNASGIFLAKDNRDLSINDWVTGIARHLGESIRLFRVPSIILMLIKRLKPGLYNRLFGSLVLNNDKSLKKLRFANPYSTENGIKNMINWYLERKRID